MPSTAYYSRIDPRHPAAFSATVLQGLVRRQLGFPGVVVSDDLGSAKQVARWTPGQRATMFIDAGGDMVLTVDASVVPAMVQAVTARMAEQPGVRAQGRRGGAAGAHGQAPDGPAALSRPRRGWHDAVMRSRSENDEQRAFRQMVRAFLTEKVAPHAETWEREGLVPRSLYAEFGALGVTGLQVPEEYGGGGETSFAYNAILTEEIVASGAATGALLLHLNVVLPYFLAYGTPEQLARWCPGFVSGELVTAIAMTEPGTGSDLAGITATAVRDGDHYVLDGAKTFITGGVQADLVVVVARTSRDAADRRGGLTLLVVEDGMPGLLPRPQAGEAGPALAGHRRAVLRRRARPGRQPAGRGGPGVRLPRRQPAAGADGDRGRLPGRLRAGHRADPRLRARAHRVRHARRGVPEHQVRAGRPVGQGRGRPRSSSTRRWPTSTGGELSGADAARIKLFATELQAEVVDACLQLHGGYGYMLEYPIARMYADARVSRIYGGSSEIMKVIIAKDLGL